MPRPSRHLLRTARVTLAAYTRAYEEGVTAAIFAIALLVLLGMVAVGIDGSQLYDERRQAQNAADHAAVAAALASCDPALDNAARDAAAQAAGLASANANGYNDVPSNEVTIVAEGTAEHLYTALIDTTIPTTFAQVLGIGQHSTGANAKAEATGCAPTSGGVPALHGGGTCPDTGKYSIQTNGQNHHIWGDVHSNDEIDLGSTNNFHDPVTYVTQNSNSPKNHTDDTYDDGPPSPVGTQPWPPGFDPTVITGATSGAPATGTWLRPYYDLAVAASPSQVNTSTSVTVNQNGVWYLTNTNEISVSISAGVTDVVIIATRGPIKISGGLDHRTLNSYDHASLPTPDLILMSNEIYTGNDACDRFTIQISAQHSTWNGIMWAPRGLMEMSASNTTVNGGLVGHAIRLNGSDHLIRESTTAPTLDPDVLLLD